MPNQAMINSSIFLQPNSLPLRGVRSSVTSNALPIYKHRSSEIVSKLKKLRSTPLNVDDDDDYRRAGQSKEALPPRPITKLSQLEELHLTRHRIEQLLNRVAFEQVMLNCFVRVNISAPGEKPVFRIAEVQGMEHLKVGYYLGSMATNIALQLRYDDLVELHEIKDVSNVPFTQEEFELWRDNNVGQAIQPPPTSLIAHKKMQLYNTLNSERKVVLPEERGWTVPVRSEPRGGLVQRRGTAYPWKLRSPSPPRATDPGSVQESELELEALNEELEAKRSLVFDHQLDI